MAYSVEVRSYKGGPLIETYASIADCGKHIKHDPIYLATKLSQGIKRGQTEIKVNGVWLKRVKRVIVEDRPAHEIVMGRVPDPKPLGPTPESLDEGYQAEADKVKDSRKRNDGTDFVRRFDGPSSPLALPNTAFCQCCSRPRAKKDMVVICLHCMTTLQKIREAVKIIGQSIIGGRA